MGASFDGDGFTVERIVVGALDNNVYLVRDHASGNGILVDAAADPAAIIEMAADTNIAAVVTTHGHHDHLGAAAEVSSALGVPFQLHPLDIEIAGMTPDEIVVEGPHRIGRTPFTIVHTPGHTPGSVCLVFDGVVLTGDTLFPGGPGATRFAYSSFDDIITSIRNALFTLPDASVVLPGHGPATTIGTERPALGDWIARRW